MCGRYALAYSSEELPSHFKSYHLPVSPRIDKGEHHDRSFNLAPTSDGAVYRAKDHELRYMKWGLVPHWTKSLKDFKTYKTFNARVENLLDSRMWTQCCGTKRCVIPLNGYYEWKTKGRKKIPYYVVRNDGKLAFVAGLYDYLESEDMWTFTIITAVAPKKLTWLHERMPVLLEPGSKEWETWMDPDKKDWTREELNELLAAHYDEKKLSVYQVSDDVNKVGKSSESMVKPIYKEDRDKFNLERFPEEEEQEGEGREGPPSKRLKAEPKEESQTQGTLMGKSSGDRNVKKERKGPMVEGDQEEDLEVEDTSLAQDDADDIEDAFVKEGEDPGLEEEYLKQSDDEEVEAGDLVDVGEEEDEDYLEAGDENDENAEGSDYTEEVQMKDTQEIKGGSIGERVKNEDTEREAESAPANADTTSQEPKSRKRRTSGRTTKGDSGENSSKWGSMNAHEAGKKGGSKSSRSATGEHGTKERKMSASEAGRKGGRRSSKN